VPTSRARFAKDALALDNLDFVFRGVVYQGRDHREFDSISSEEDRLKWSWSTLDSRPSF
jgi:hypothetical protein